MSGDVDLGFGGNIVLVNYAVGIQNSWSVNVEDDDAQS